MATKFSCVANFTLLSRIDCRFVTDIQRQCFEFEGHYLFIFLTIKRASKSERISIYIFERERHTWIRFEALAWSNSILLNDFLQWNGVHSPEAPHWAFNGSNSKLNRKTRGDIPEADCTWMYNACCCCHVVGVVFVLNLFQIDGSFSDRAIIMAKSISLWGGPKEQAWRREARKMTKTFESRLSCYDSLLSHINWIRLV